MSCPNCRSYNCYKDKWAYMNCRDCGWDWADWACVQSDALYEGLNDLDEEDDDTESESINTHNSTIELDTLID